MNSLNLVSNNFWYILIITIGYLETKKFVLVDQRTTLVYKEIICELQKCYKSQKCLGIYMENKQYHHITQFSDKLFSGLLNIFINSKYILVFTTLRDSYNYRTKFNGYFTFAHIEFKAYKTFDDYADGFYYDKTNYYLGNEFLHQLSTLHPLQFSMTVTVDGKTITAEHSGCVFLPRGRRYEANIGNLVYKTSFVETLTFCMTGSRYALHGNGFTVSNDQRYAFWGTCWIPYKRGLLFKKPYAKKLILKVKYNF
ncbi:hypothetical protein SNEBB_008177 [Seison nebaliae]|nr:hypothetical protein SNEBB_008177 [Seison nebaliae]